MNRVPNFIIICALASLGPVSAFAQITNEVTVTGSYGSTNVSSKDDVAVDVIEAAPDLLIEKTIKDVDLTKGATPVADAGDTITFQFVVTNKGNVTLTGVTPVDDGLMFGTQSATNTMGAFVVAGSDPVANSATLAPNETATFEAVYVLADLDVFHAADTKDLVGDAKKLVVNTASSQGNKPVSGDVYEDTDTSSASMEIAPNPLIKVEKVAVLNDEVDANGQAQVGETITYTYTVTNIGNVPLTGIGVEDVHEDVALVAGKITSEKLVTEGPLELTTGAVSTDAAVDGGWDLLQPEAVIEFIYEHIVTQDEVDNG